MAKKTDLKSKLSELKTAIVSNSKDDHLAKKLLANILSVKGQMCIEPLPFAPLGKELGVFKGNTFTITKYENAAVFHVYNSMDIIARNNDESTSLYETLVDYVDHQDEYNSLEGDLKERFDLHLAATVYVLSIPRFAFSDADFCYDIATRTVEFLRTQLEKVDDVELPEETVQEDKEFEKAAMSLENIKDNIKED